MKNFRPTGQPGTVQQHQAAAEADEWRRLPWWKQLLREKPISIHEARLPTRTAVADPGWVFSFFLMGLSTLPLYYFRDGISRATEIPPAVLIFILAMIVVFCSLRIIYSVAPGLYGAMSRWQTLIAAVVAICAFLIEQDINRKEQKAIEWQRDRREALFHVNKLLSDLYEYKYYAFDGWMVGGGSEYLTPETLERLKKLATKPLNQQTNNLDWQEVKTVATCALMSDFTEFAIDTMPMFVAARHAHLADELGLQEEKIDLLAFDGDALKAAFLAPDLYGTGKRERHIIGPGQQVLFSVRYDNDAYTSFMQTMERNLNMMSARAHKVKEALRQNTPPDAGWCPPLLEHWENTDEWIKRG